MIYIINYLPHPTQLQEVTRRNYLSITQIHMQDLISIATE